MAQCKIMLDNYLGSFNAGNEIRGRVECYFDDETTLRGIKIRLRGREYNEWTDSEEYLDTQDNTYKTRFVQFTGDRDFVFMEQMLFGSVNSTQTLGRGRHIYPFSIHLPANLPASHRGKYGTITFELKAVVDRPMRTDYEDTFMVNVASPIDLNKFPEEAFHPVELSDEKTVCCWCCKGGNITVQVILPKIAFIPGEVVHFQIIVSNLSNLNARKVTYTLKKVVQCSVENPSSATKSDEEQILEFSDHGVGAHGEHTYNMEMRIPEHIEVSNFSLCTLFKSTYTLRVVVKMPKCSMNLDVECDVNMGHIPIGQAPPMRPPINAPHLQSGDFYNQPIGYQPPAPFEFHQPGPGGAAFPSNVVYPPPGSSNSISGDGGPYPAGNIYPSAPFPVPSGPDGDNPKAREASAPPPKFPESPAELPPPSYSEAQKTARQ